MSSRWVLSPMAPILIKPRSTDASFLSAGGDPRGRFGNSPDGDADRLLIADQNVKL